MYRHVDVKSWVGISGECPISYSLDSAGAVVFMFGNPPNDFEVGFDVDSLRRFLSAGDKALPEMVSREGFHSS